MDIIKRIIKWNSQRYRQEHCRILTYNLLNEEVLEFKDSITDVDTLDALCDIIYVSIGAMWKMGLDDAQINEAIKIVCDSNDSKTKPNKKCKSNIKANLVKGKKFIKPETFLKELLDERNRKNT